MFDYFDEKYYKVNELGDVLDKTPEEVYLSSLRPIPKFRTPYDLGEYCDFESSDEPSVTDESAYESIEELLARARVTGFLPKETVDVPVEFALYANAEQEFGHKYDLTDINPYEVVSPSLEKGLPTEADTSEQNGVGPMSSPKAIPSAPSAETPPDDVA